MAQGDPNPGYSTVHFIHRFDPKPGVSPSPFHDEWPTETFVSSEDDDDIRSDLRMLHHEMIGFLRTAILDSGVLTINGVAIPFSSDVEVKRAPFLDERIQAAILFLKEVPCPPPLS